MARTTLNREFVLLSAVRMADADGLASFSMRKLAQSLGVVPMALYKHVANKDELLDGMIDAVVGEIPPPAGAPGWKDEVRQRILAARRALLRHPWAAPVIEARGVPTPAVLAYMNGLIGMLRAGGLSADLTHHAMHALGSRMLGFSQELFDDSTPADPRAQQDAAQAMAARYPHIAEMAAAAAHAEESTVGGGCDDQFEFEFALDLILDGLERRRDLRR